MLKRSMYYNKCRHATAFSFMGPTTKAIQTLNANGERENPMYHSQIKRFVNCLLCPKFYCALSRRLIHTGCSALYEDLKKYRKFTGLCWLYSPVPPVVTKLPMPSVEEIICSDEFLWARGIQEQLEFLVHSRVLAGWVSRHSVDGHFLKNMVLFFICCFINCSFWAGPIVQFGCLLFESWPKAWFTVTN